MGVIGVYPTVKVGLQLLYRSVYLLPKGDGVELVLYRSVEPFTNAVCLRTFRFDFGVVYVFNGQIQFILMRFPVSIIFGSSVGEHPHQLQVMLFKEWNNPVIEHVRRNKSVLPVVELGEADFGIGVDDCLQVDVPYAFYTLHNKCPAPQGSLDSKSLFHPVPVSPPWLSPAQPPGSRQGLYLLVPLLRIMLSDVFERSPYRDIAKWSALPRVIEDVI